jgi:hypothetical protein
VKRESDSSGGALLLLARGCPGPWKELVEAIVRPEIDEADENIGKIGLGLDVVQFAESEARRTGIPTEGGQQSDDCGQRVRAA